MKQGGNLAYDVFVNEPPAQDTAAGFFNAKIARYPDHLGRMILWVSARARYGVRERPGENPAQLILASWLD